MTGLLVSLGRPGAGLDRPRPDPVMTDQQDGPTLRRVNHALTGQPARMVGQVLCVDPGGLDSMLLREVGELRRSCLEIVSAPDAAGVRQVLQDGDVLLILLSPSLHDVAWDRLVAELCASQEAPVWVWGGHAHPEERARALSAGAAAYRDKPHDIEGYGELLREIEQFVNPG